MLLLEDEQRKWEAGCEGSLLINVSTKAGHDGRHAGVLVCQIKTRLKRRSSELSRFKVNQLR